MDNYYRVRPNKLFKKYKNQRRNSYTYGLIKHIDLFKKIDLRAKFYSKSQKRIKILSIKSLKFLTLYILLIEILAKIGFCVKFWHSQFKKSFLMLKYDYS